MKTAKTISVDLSNKNKPKLWIQYGDDDTEDELVRISQKVAKALVETGTNFGG